MIRNLIAVGIGGAVGAMLRYGMTVLGIHMRWSPNLSTFLVNVIGSFVMGLLVSRYGHGTLMMAATVGLCGGFTTFSTFSIQSVNLVQEGKLELAALYVLGTLVTCVIMAWMGCIAGRNF